MDIFYGIEIELLLGINCKIFKNSMNYVTITFFDNENNLIENINIPPENIKKQKDNYFIEIKNVQNYKLTQKIIEIIERYLKNKIKNIKNIVIDNSIRIYPNEFINKNLFIIPCEIISKKLIKKELEIFIEDIINIQKYLNISYNDTCGVHISYSIPSLEIKDKIKIIDKTIVPNFNLLNFIIGNKIDVLNSKIRYNKDDYSISTDKIIIKMINDFKLKKYNYNDKILKILKKIKYEKYSKKILDLINYIYLKIYNTKKYQVINIKDYLTNNGRVEVRMFTTFYLYKRKKIVLKILDYIVQQYIKYNTSYVEKKKIDDYAKERIKKIIENVKF